MAERGADGLTKLELRVMQAIWKLGASTVAAVQGEMDPPAAYTTVQTMLNILERKGRLTRVLEGRAYVYSPTVPEHRALGQELRGLVDRMFGGSSEALVMSLVRDRQLDAKKLAKMLAKLEKKEGK